MVQCAELTGAEAGAAGQTFGETMAYVLPRRDEVKWQEIPWQTDLWTARQLAAEQGKPIFLWAMNGNPLGCT